MAWSKSHIAQVRHRWLTGGHYRVCCLGQRLVVPMNLTDEYDPSIIALATAVPATASALFYHFLVRPRERRRRKQYATVPKPSALPLTLLIPGFSVRLSRRLRKSSPILVAKLRIQSHYSKTPRASTCKPRSPSVVRFTVQIPSSFSDACTHKQVSLCWRVLTVPRTQQPMPGL